MSSARISWDLPRRHPWATRVGLALAFAIALGYGPHLLAGGAEERIDTLSKQLEETRAAIAATERENAKFRKRVRALKNEPDAIEEIARRDLGLVRSGEVVIDLKSAEAAEEK